MKRNLIIVSIAFLLLTSFSQKKTDTINLSFNILDKNFKARKYTDDKGWLNFYIENEHFISKQQPVPISKHDLQSIQIIDIKEFNRKSDVKRKKLIKEGEKTGTINILSNSNVFGKIYLYEKNKDGLIYKYRVTWVEEIIN